MRGEISIFAHMLARSENSLKFTSAAQLRAEPKTRSQRK